MSNNSVVEHRANYYFVEFREEFLLICQNSSYKKQAKNGKKSAASPHCKALILAILENWTNSKRGKKEALAIFMTYSQWVDSMYGMFGRTVIIDSLEELIGDGLLSREPYKMFGNKDTYQYRLHYQELNDRLKQLPERDIHDIHPKADAYPSKNERDASKNERVTHPKMDVYPSKNERDASKNERVTHPKMDAHPSKNGRNIESSQIQNIDSSQREIAEQPKESSSCETEASLSPSLTQKKSSKKKDDVSLKGKMAALLDAWDEIEGHRLPRTEKQKKAAKELAEVSAQKEDLVQIRQFCYQSNPEWYAKQGVDLPAIANNWGKWKSVQNPPKISSSPQNGKKNGRSPEQAASAHVSEETKLQNQELLRTKMTVKQQKKQGVVS